MSLPHFGSRYVTSDAPKILEHQNIKLSQTILKLRGGIHTFERVQSSLQFFINCAEDLFLLGEKVCLITNVNWQNDQFLPSTFLGDIFYTTNGSGHRAPREKSTIFYDRSDIVENLCSYDWIFLFDSDLSKEAEIFSTIYSKTVFLTSEDGSKIENTWWRHNDSPKLSCTGKGNYQHINKNGKITVEDDTEVEHNLLNL
jgi:hypothetical protein